MNLLRIDSSIRVEGSVSRAVADSLQKSWLDEHPAGTLVHRDLGLHPLDAQAWTETAVAARVPADQRTPQQSQVLAAAQPLADEALAADAFLIAAPLYNYGPPASLKTWIDFLLTDPTLGPYGSQPLKGRPAVLVIARGGGYGEGTPRAGWDHATGWLQRILTDVFGLDLKTVAAELTLADVNPAMAELRPLAAASLEQAHTAAAAHGRHLAGTAAVPIA